MNNIILVNNPFTKGENKAFFINNDNDRFNYFYNKENKFIVRDVNFLINDGVNSKVQSVAFDTNNFYELSKYNYCVYYKTDENDNVIMDSVRYYFATIRQAGGKLYNFDLELDDISTNYFRNRRKIYGLINKAHIDRFKKVGDNFQYNITKESAFINQTNNYNTNKYLKDVYKLETNEYSSLYNWMSKHVKYWVLCMLSDGLYKIQPPHGVLLDAAVPLPLQYDNYKCPYGIVFFPVMEDGYKIKCEYFQDGVSYKIDIDGDGFYKFAKLEGNSPKFYNILYTTDLIFNVLYSLKRLEDNDKTLILSAETGGDLPYLGLYDSLSHYSEDCAVILSDPNTGIFTGLKVKDSVNYISAELNDFIRNNFIFEKDFIKNNTNKLSPMLATNSALHIRLNSDGADVFDYDLSLMLTDDSVKDIVFKNTYAIDTSGTTNYIRLGNNYGLYNENYINSQIGLCENKIVSIPWANDKFSEYVANNKNYMFTSISNIVSGGISGTIGLGKEIIGAQEGLISPIDITTNTISKAVNIGLSVANLNASFDNMKNSKQSLFANSTSYFYKLQKDKHGYFVDIYTLTDYDKNKMLNDLKVNGYNVDKLDYISKYDNIRKYYNHISVIIDEIDDDNLTMLEKDRLIEKLKDFTFVSTEANLSALYDNLNYETYFDIE